MDMSTLYPAGDRVAEKRACERARLKKVGGACMRALRALWRGHVPVISY